MSRAKVSSATLSPEVSTPAGGVGDELGPTRGLIGSEAGRRIADAAVGFRRGPALPVSIGAEGAG